MFQISYQYNLQTFKIKQQFYELIIQIKSFKIDAKCINIHKVLLQSIHRHTTHQLVEFTRLIESRAVEQSGKCGM